MDPTIKQTVDELSRIGQTKAAIEDKLGQVKAKVRASTRRATTTWHDLTRGASADVRRMIDSANEAVLPPRSSPFRPWGIVGSAVLLGCVLGQLHRRSARRVMPYYPPGAQGVDVMPQERRSGKGPRAGVYAFYPQDRITRESEPVEVLAGMLADLSRHLGRELAGATNEVLILGREALTRVLRQALVSGFPLVRATGSDPWGRRHSVTNGERPT